MPVHEPHRRRLTRFVTEAEIEAFNTLTEAKIGKVIDIHQQGLMLMARSVPTVDHIYYVRLEPRGQAAEKIRPFQLGLDCLWVRDMATKGCAWAGFRIIDMSVRASDCVQRVIDLYGRPVDE